MELGSLWRGRPARKKTTDHEISMIDLLARGNFGPWPFSFTFR
jgi:hypothetical protein